MGTEIGDFEADIRSALITLFKEKYRKVVDHYYLTINDQVNVHLSESCVIILDSAFDQNNSSVFDYDSPSFIDDILSAVQHRLDMKNI